MIGLNTARGDFIPGGDGILSPGALLFHAKSRRGESGGRKCSATPVLFLLTGTKWVFRPAGATRCPDKRESWHGAADRGSAPPSQLSRLSGQKCGNTAPKTVKISNFGHKFASQGRLVCNIFTKFLSFVRV